MSTRSGVFHLFINDLKESNFSVTTDRTASAEPISFEPDDILKKNIGTLSKRGPNRTQLNLIEFDQICSAVGEALFTCFIEAAPNACQEFRKASTAGGPRLALHLPPSLYYLPWETLRDPQSPPNNFIATRQGGSIFRCDGSNNARVTSFPSMESPLEFMFLVPNPTDMYFGSIPTPVSNTAIKFVSVDPASLSRYREIVKKKSDQNFRGIIFIGHGTIENNVGHLVFVNRVHNYKYFAEHLSDPHPGWCVVEGFERSFRLGIFCACESAWAGKTVDFPNTVVGANLGRSETIAYIIGAQSHIDAKAAQTMLAVCLQSIVESGCPLDLALSEARTRVRAIKMNPQYSPFDWWIPVLYTKTTDLQILDTPTIRFETGESTASAATSISIGQFEPRSVAHALFRRLSNLIGPTNGPNIFD